MTSPDDVIFLKFSEIHGQYFPLSNFKKKDTLVFSSLSSIRLGLSPKGLVKRKRPSDRYQPGRLIECSQDRDWKEVFRSSKCNMPIKPEDKNSYKPDANVNGCGPCVESDCITTFSGENEPTHKCYGWIQGDEGWIPSETLMNCYQADTAEKNLKCSLPRYRSNKDGFNSNGCGPCPEEEANISDENAEYNCMTSDPEKNSGIQFLISFLTLILTLVNTVL